MKLKKYPIFSTTTNRCGFLNSIQLIYTILSYRFKFNCLDLIIYAKKLNLRRGVEKTCNFDFFDSINKIEVDRRNLIGRTVGRSAENLVFLEFHRVAKFVFPTFHRFSW